MSAPPGGSPGPTLFQFTIDPKTPLKDLLPAAPKVRKAGPLLGDDLAQVPEVEFQTPVAKDNAEALKQTAHQLAKINHLNAQKADRFLEALRGERPDLNGLPFAMGDVCRTKGERSRQFAAAVATVRQALRNQRPVAEPFSRPGTSLPPSSPSTSGPRSGGTTIVQLAESVAVTITEDQSPVATERFWEQYLAAVAQEDKALAQVDRVQKEHVTLARVAALMQVLAPEAPSMRLGLVKYLSTVAHAEATRTLARLAIFSAEVEVRQAALDALKVRRERDYTDVLLQGLRYPLPAVAKRTGDALVKLERTDLVPKLVEVLDEPDPRAPVLKPVDRKKVPVVRELVRINHHRNCLLCHAPGNTDHVGPEALTAGIPMPNEPLTPPSRGYQNSVPDVLVRVDVTYLRQDFSVRQPVADASPWPEMQRFDFLVRSRVLTEEEAADFREKLEPREPGQLSPYHRAALAALRELTGKDTAPTADAWRQLLKLPVREK